MKEEPLDRRVRKTRRQLRECLIALLKQKKVQEITVKEITDMADLNRGTFYLHYKDVFDLLEKTEAELLDEFNQLLLRHDAEELRSHSSSFFSDVFSLVAPNADLIEILIGENGDLNFVNRLKRLIREKTLREWTALYQAANPAVFDAYLSYMVSGCLGLVQYWLQSGRRETPQQMAELTRDIVNRGIGVLDGAADESLPFGRRRI